jgi:hypothetical protein
MWATFFLCDSYVLSLTKMDWAIFLQTHLVTLPLHHVARAFWAIFHTNHPVTLKVMPTGVRRAAKMAPIFLLKLTFAAAINDRGPMLQKRSA